VITRRLAITAVALALVAGGILFVSTRPNADRASAETTCRRAIMNLPEVPDDAQFPKPGAFEPDRYSENVIGVYDVRWPTSGVEHQGIYTCELTPSGEIVHVSTD
jgi:hypothetical protein